MHPAGSPFLKAITDLKDAGLASLVTLGQTLWCWRDEIARLWRFTRNNGITEGFHTKMEALSRQAYGFRNFENSRSETSEGIMCVADLGAGSPPYLA